MLHLSQLSLTQFRNYTSLALTLQPGINCITGPNGSGKTNILDAIHFLALMRSLRNAQDALAIQDGATFFLAEAEIVRNEIARKVQVNTVKGRGKQVFVSGKKTKPAEYYGQIPLIAVLPNATDLVNGPAADRRLMMDMLLSQYDHAYLHHLSAYNRLIELRNGQLKQFEANNTFDSEMLWLWNEQLIPHGIALQTARSQFVAEFLPVFSEFFAAIVSERETPGLAYEASIADNTPDGWREALRQQEAKDRVLCRTGAGIHRDELAFTIDGTSVRHYGSQGQQKTFVIALKLAEYALLEAHAGYPPVLLLDDIFDKLDESRLHRIADLLCARVRGQVFVTDTSFERLQSAFGEGVAAHFVVGDGGMVSEK